jgi:hypothetical protein
MKKTHDVNNVVVTEDRLCLSIDGKDYHFPLAEVSPRLLAASPVERGHFEISPSGYGIHWPTIDEDLSIDGLLGISHKPSFLAQKAVV